MAVVSDLCDPKFWGDIYPDLTVTPQSSEFTEGSGAPVLAELDDGWRDHLIHEGYLNLPGAFSADRIHRLRSAVETLVSRNLPPVFATVYDEFWELFHHFVALCRPIMGDEIYLPPSIWIWYLKPSQEDTGFPPHRDRPDLGHDLGDLPKSLTVWAPLTDATPLNGCMYIVPAYLDKAYLESNDRIPAQFHDIRALPAPAGSVLMWNQRMLHWGGKSSRRAANPRISVAIELQRNDIPSSAKPLMQTLRRPSLNMRLKIIGRSALFYRTRYQYPQNAIDLFSGLSDLDAPDAPPDWDEG